MPLITFETVRPIATGLLQVSWSKAVGARVSILHKLATFLGAHIKKRWAKSQVMLLRA